MDTKTEADEAFRIAIKSRAYHADLLAASQKVGGHEALARHLRVSVGTINNWILLKSFPRLECVYKDGRVKKNTALARKWPSIEKKLFALTGKSIKQLFPDFVRLSGILEADKNKTEVHEVTAGMMLGHTRRPLKALADHSVSTDEMKERIGRVMDTLPIRHRRCLVLRYGLEGEPPRSLEETGKILGVTRERVRQIEISALRKIRNNPARTKEIEPALEAIDFHPCPKCGSFFPEFRVCDVCRTALCESCFSSHRDCR